MMASAKGKRSLARAWPVRVVVEMISGRCGMSVFEALGQRDAGERFADGDGVNPDGAGALGWQFVQRRSRETETVR